MADRPRRRPRSRAAVLLLVPSLFAACSRPPTAIRPSDDAASLVRRPAATTRVAAPPSPAGLPAQVAEPGPREGRREAPGATAGPPSATALDLRAARDAVACRAEAPRGRTLLLEPRDPSAGCAVALNDAVREALAAAAFPEGRAACARLPCDEASKQAGATAVSKLAHASAARGAFTAPGRDQIAWALVAHAESLPPAFALTALLVTEGDAVVARAEPEALSHGTLALAKALDVDGDGADEFVTRTSTSWMGEGHVDAALVGVRAGRLVELEPFADLLVEHTGAGSGGEADAATRLYVVPAGAAGPAAFQTEAFVRGCRPANAPSARPAAKPCAGGAADWRRAGSAQ